MEFHFTEEQEQFREFVRRFLNDISPTTEVRRVMETEQGFDPGTWQRLSQELSLTGLVIPEAYGGAGFGNVELGIAMEEMGRALYPSPFLGSCVLAAKAIEYAGSESEKSELLPSIAAGDKIAALAFLEGSGPPDLSSLQMTVTGQDGSYRLTGTKTDPDSAAGLARWFAGVARASGDHSHGRGACFRRRRGDSRAEKIAL